MKKKEALDLLGGTVTSAAREIGITTNAVSRWPETLSNAISDRVQAALYRRMIAEQAQPSKRRKPSRNGDAHA